MILNLCMFRCISYLSKILRFKTTERIFILMYFMACIKKQNSQFANELLVTLSTAGDPPEIKHGVTVLILKTAVRLIYS